MLRDAKRREKFRVVRENFFRRMAAVKIAKQSGHGFHDKRIGITGEETFAIAKFGGQPQFRQTAGNQVCLHAFFRRQRWKSFCAPNEETKTILPVFERGEGGGKLKLFFRERHGAEKNLFRRWRRFRTFRWRHRLLTFRRRTARFVTTRLETGRRLRATLRLDAAERAAKFVQLAFIGELLALGDFDEFQNFIHLVVQFFQRIGDERGVRNGLVNGSGFGGTKIGGLDPLALRGGDARRRTLLARFTRFTRLALFPLFALGKLARTRGRGT